MIPRPAPETQELRQPTKKWAYSPLKDTLVQIIVLLDRRMPGLAARFASEPHFEVIITPVAQRPLIITSEPTSGPQWQTRGIHRFVSVGFFVSRNKHLVADPQVTLSDTGYPLSVTDPDGTRYSTLEATNKGFRVFAQNKPFVFEMAQAVDRDLKDFGYVSEARNGQHIDGASVREWHEEHK